MAAALFNQVADPKKACAISAGTQPAASVHPEVVEVMKEIGIDLSQTIPQKLTDELAAQAQWLITMGCGEACPVVPGLKREDWVLEDPKGKSLDEVRRIRDRIREEVGRIGCPSPLDLNGRDCTGPLEIQEERCCRLNNGPVSIKTLL